jgi:hypothetical protein
MRGTRVKRLKAAFLVRYGHAPRKADWRKVIRVGRWGWDVQHSEWRVWKKLTRGMKLEVARDAGVVSPGGVRGGDGDNRDAGGA